LTAGCHVNSAERGILQGRMTHGQGSAWARHQHTASMGASAAGQKLKECETISPSVPTGHRQKGRCLHSPPNHRF